MILRIVQRLVVIFNYSVLQSLFLNYHKNNIIISCRCIRVILLVWVRVSVGLRTKPAALVSSPCYVFSF